MKYLLTLREFSWRVAKSPTLIVGPCFLSVMLRQGRADILFGMAGSCAEGHESLWKAFSGGEGGILNQALELSCHVFSNMCETAWILAISMVSPVATVSTLPHG